MGMMLGGKSSQRAEINMTPMIDVLLVLIIIFMVITPTVPKGLQTAIPQQDSQQHSASAPTHDIVISIGKDRGLRLNQEPIETAALALRLKSLHRAGAVNYIFVRGDRGLNFSDVVSVIDLARGAGWDRIGLMTQ